MNERRVRFLWVEGEDAGEFADLAGTAGVLTNLRGDGLTYRPDRRGDWLQMVGAAPVPDSEGRLRVTTSLGNVFVFREEKG
jgi:hypothetical protein